MLYRFDDYELDSDSYQLLKSGQAITLEPQVFDVLSYLLAHHERIISREELLDELWEGKIVSDATINSCIKAARQAIGDSGKAQRYIATYSRRGYRFVADIDILESPSREALSGSKHPKQQKTLWSGRPSIAVIPFAHNPGSEEAAWVSHILSEDISIQLARIPGFMVISRNSMAYYGTREISISQVGRELGTDYVVEGSVWQSDGRLRVSVQLLETLSNRFLWADKTEIQADRLNDLQDDIVRKIVGQIEPELNRAEFAILHHKTPLDLGAWALYRKGHALLGLKGWSEETFAETADLLRRAIAIDPDLAFAHAYLALILAIGHLIGLVTDDASRDEAMREAETAIALDAQNSDVLGYSGCALADLGELERGVGLMRRAVELDPSNAQAHAALGAALLHLGQIEGIEEMQYGIRISPRDNRIAAWGALLARGLLSMGKVDEAIETAEHACRSDDKIFLPRVILALAQITAGNSEAARLALEDARRIRPRLSMNDISRFAAPQEIASLEQVGLL
ncbi:MAG: winged helix-turn-helix domain-containing protein [Gammaproteobacteria bacterium]|nr:winged helix-turn-helix domain-containing protein [Gammaproteobacteria bacterium]